MYYTMTDINTEQNLSMVESVNVIYIPQKYRKLRADRLTNLSLDASSLQNKFDLTETKILTRFLGVIKKSLACDTQRSNIVCIVHQSINSIVKTYSIYFSSKYNKLQNDALNFIRRFSTCKDFQCVCKSHTERDMV